MSRICASTWFWRPEAPTSCRVAAARPQTLASDTGIAFSWLLSQRRQALILLARHMAFPARPNVELTGPLRQDGLARAGKMYRVPQPGPRRPAVVGPVFSDGLCRTLVLGEKGLWLFLKAHYQRRPVTADRRAGAVLRRCGERHGPAARRARRGGHHGANVLLGGLAAIADLTKPPRTLSVVAGSGIDFLLARNAEACDKYLHGFATAANRNRGLFCVRRHCYPEHGLPAGRAFGAA